MTHPKPKKPLRENNLTKVAKEMNKPRMSRSARIAELRLDANRAVEAPSTSMPGKVRKIIPSRRWHKTEAAEITVAVPDKRYGDFRIENTLTDEHGDDVKLKKGGRVEVTVTAKGKRGVR